MRGMIALALFLFTSFAQSADFNKGAYAYKKGDYKTAYNEVVALAEQGNAKAQFNLGLMYENGQGVPQDDKQAVYWFRKAAEQGNAKAQYNLGVMYAKGQGVLQDNKKAYMWFNLARYNGYKDTKSAFNLMEKVMAPVDVGKAQEASNICLESNYKKCG